MHHSASIDHAQHDLSLIAGHAAGDLSNLETAAATELLTTCSACADIHHDLVTIASAMRALPHTARAPRDFRLSAEQAQRLQRGSWLRTLLRPFASARSATRPVAAAFTSLGVAGLLVATFVPGLLGGMASSPGAREAAGAGTASTHAPAMAPEYAGPTIAAQGAPGAPTADIRLDAGDSGTYVALNGETPVNAGNDADSAVEELQARSSSPPNLLLLGSAGLLAIGLALFGLRLAARRVR